MTAILDDVDNDQQKIIEYMKIQRITLLENASKEGNFTKEELSKEIDHYKVNFNRINKNLSNCYEKIDELNAYFSVALRNKQYADIEKYNKELDTERQKLRTLSYEISGIYATSATLLVKCMSKIL